MDNCTLESLLVPERLHAQIRVRETLFPSKLATCENEAQTRTILIHRREVLRFDALEH